jgi:pyrimidine-nucleoside phosphorylase
MSLAGVSFLPSEIIKKKRNGFALTENEISFFVDGYNQLKIPDYQMSALLMAIVLKGMDITEAAYLTKAMLHSGRTLQFTNTPYLPVDKHSTGGVGDKTSLLIAPIVASCGVPVPMIAGRGLGHTGGTLDKLESIPGFDIQLSLEDFQKQVLKIGCAIIGQTEDICPADKKMYSLRDVTATVESLALICGSILSKKIAEGIKGLVMDVKCGSGAFMKTQHEAEELASWLAKTAAKNGVRTTAFITNMQEPLGRFIGNAIEVLECVSVFTQEPVLGWAPDSFADMRELSLVLSAEMLVLSGRSSNSKEARLLAEEALNSGKAFEMFKTLVATQKGRWNDFSFPENLKWHSVASNSDGFINEYNTEAIGLAGICLGAGRRVSQDPIDFLASIIVHKKLGDAVKSGETLFSFYSPDDAKIAEARPFLEGCVKISLQKTSRPSLILNKFEA